MITYNHEKYIVQSIDSVLMQRTNFDYEIVIGEDCSTDKTREIVLEYKAKYTGRIKLLLQEKNVGMMQNFIDTLRACNGKYIALLEGDDYWTDPLKLQKQMDFLEANPEYGMISSDVNLIDENGQAIPDNNMVLKQRANYKSTVDFFDLLEVNHVNTLTVCARADLMKELAGRVIRENLWFVYDHWFWLNISLASKIIIFSEKTAAYRISVNGVSRSKDFFKIRKPLVLQDVIFRFFLYNGNKKINLEEMSIISNYIVETLLFSKLSIRQKVTSFKLLYKYPVLFLLIINSLFIKVYQKIRNISNNF